MFQVHHNVSLPVNPSIERRSFLYLGLATLTRVPIVGRRDPAPQAPEPLAAFPRQEPAMVEEMVRVSHGNLDRVKQLVERRPALAKTAFDWGFGDWEDALGAASHVGRRDIAQLLLEHGARPTLFSAAMMGHLDLVKAFVAATPGCQRILGPHSIPLLSHARAGGEVARPVREYLEQLGGADGPTVAPLGAADRAALLGTYRFGPGVNDRLEIAAAGDGLSINRPGTPFPRGMKHLGNNEFFPMGAESVRIRFTLADGRASAVGVYDPDLVVTGSLERT